MLNMDQNKLVEVINQYIINRYTQNITLAKSRIIKLFYCFPHTGAPNISEAINIAVIEDLNKFVSSTYTLSNN